MYSLRKSGQFKKDVKLCHKRSYDLSLLHKAISLLEETGHLPIEYKPHQLQGNYAGITDAHIENDWLLLYKVYDTDDFEFEGEVVLYRTGTHSDLFK